MRVPQLIKDREQIAQEKMDYWEAVMEKFKGNCVVCYPNTVSRFRGGVTVHEIVPRSKLPNSWWKSVENGCPLCQEDHTRVHEMSQKDAEAFLAIHIEKTLRALGKL